MKLPLESIRNQNSNAPGSKELRDLRERSAKLLRQKGIEALEEILEKHYVELTLISMVYGIDITAERAAAKELERLAGSGRGTGGNLEEMRKKLKIG